MARQPINIGSFGNDGTGDKLRIAFNKVNENFGEVYYNVSNTDIRLNSVYDIANSGYNVANAAFNYANTILGESTNLTPVFSTANAAFDKANLNTTLITNLVLPNVIPAFETANLAYEVANAAFDAANNAVTDFSPAFNKANDSYELANAAYNYANTIIGENTNLTDVFDVANAAFGYANSMNLNSLTDVDVDYGVIGVGDVLKWNGSHWEGGVDATSGGAGTNADTLDGFHGSYYLDYHNFANTPNLNVYATAANVANSLISANNYAGEMANAANSYASSLTPDLTAANNYAGAMANSVNAYTSVTYATVTNAASGYAVANAAFDKANSANVLAYNTGIGANAYASSVGTNANNYANTILTGGTSNLTLGNVTINYVFDSGRFTKLSGVEESFGTYSSVTGVTQFDCSNNYIFYVSPSGNFTPNLTNFICDTNNVTSITFVLNQGVTPYMSISNLLIGAANLAINWQGGTAPTGTASKKDILTLSIMNINGANTVLGQLVSFG